MNEATAAGLASPLANEVTTDGSNVGITRLDWLEPFATQFVQDVTSALARLDLQALDEVVATLARARDEGRVIFVAGNGGSAATASHWVNDLAKATRGSGKAYVRAISLTDSTSWLTALANDEGYERVFAGQLENMAQGGDVLAVISASGNSTNLIRAVDFARAKGVETVGLLGFDGGALKSMLDHHIWVETPMGAYGLAENVHTVICDLVTACLALPSPYTER